MREIQHSTEPDSESSRDSEDSTARGPDGIQNTGSPFRLIHAANRKLRLYSVLKTYSINIPRISKHQVWSATITCPLPSHKGANERTPSFGYNFIGDRFYCLGCKKSGRAVEFIAEMEGKKRNAVAQSILDHYSDSDYIDEPIEQEDPKVEELLFGMSKAFREFYQTCSDSKKIEQMEKLIWWFDSFIAIRAGSRNEQSSDLDVEELEARVQKAKELLKEIDCE